MTQLHHELQHAKTTRDLRYSYSNEFCPIFSMKKNAKFRPVSSQVGTDQSRGALRSCCSVSVPTLVGVIGQLNAI